jgi:photosystem I subunit 3
MQSTVRILFPALCSLATLLPLEVSADVSGLVPCKDSVVYNRRLEESVKKLSARLQLYEPGTPAYLAIEQRIVDTKTRFKKYADQGLLCGTEGLPHLIADGRLNHAGELILPGLGFLYIAGWIGWVGRNYLQFSRETDKPNEAEIIIDVPVALSMMSVGFLWPIESLNELFSNKLLVDKDEITVSPR